MKIAYLIIAYHQPAHLQRMIEALSTDFSTFYVHVDLKSDFKDFTAIKGENIRFIERKRVSHGGFSLTIAMLNLLQEAAENHYDYYVFLSGMDYPIKSNQVIYNFLKKNKGTSYISYYPLVGKAKFINHVDRYYLVDFVYRFPKFLSKVVKHTIRVSNYLLPSRKFVQGLTPYRGSMWATLHNDAVQYILHFLNDEKGKELLHFFKYSWGSDEIILQTVLLNSPLAHRCNYYEREEDKEAIDENKAHLHYVDWDQTREDPAVFDETDFETLVESRFLFARKFGEQKSTRLLKMLDSSFKKQKQTQIS